MNPQSTFWSLSTDQVLQQMHSTTAGLSRQDAKQRLSEFGANSLKQKHKSSAWMLLLNQFKSPIILILIFAAVLSIFLKDAADAIIILTIVLISGLLGFWQEQGASNAVEKLLALVQVKATVLRDGQSQEIPNEEVVRGDIVLLSAGKNIPGDCLVLESKDLSVDEAALTGETYPVDKLSGVLPAETGLSQRTNSLYLGTNVISGTAKAVVVHTGKETEFGKVSERLKLRPSETEFERGLSKFGYFLMEVTLILVVLIFVANVYLHRPVLESFLFSLALAVGLTPQLLPAIVSVNLARGAKKMAKKQVIVKRLPAIENFGSMNVFCTDKTGTLTEGEVKIHSAVDVEGKESDHVLLYAYLNAASESGYVNPIDAAIREYKTFDISAYQKLDEVPYDFNRKRLSILFKQESTHLIITKGALKNILDVCSTVETGEGKAIAIADQRQKLHQQADDLGSKGFRALGVAYRDFNQDSFSKDDETNMTFLGYLALFDPPKAGIADTLKELQLLGITPKMITGDSKAVAMSIIQQVGLPEPKALTGSELEKLSDEALMHQVQDTNVFAEVEPNQKERIIIALKKAGNVVGYLGDGINDASALHAADVGISVESAVDVAKEAADIVLMAKDLNVLIEGVKEGRVTFANTLKYVFMATSANFGNMFSMAGISLFLPFLPLLPSQILLTNLLTDFPELTIATDRVDKELVNKPRRMDIKFIRNFMIVFGLLSSVFDYLTFGALLLLLHAQPKQFRTGWFLESVISASLVVLVVRTRQSIFNTKPGKYLLMATLATIGVTIIIPWTPLATLLGFQPLPLNYVLVLGAIVLFYVTAAENVKRVFYSHVKF
ncbi:magnesium-translocating P-type ATPase [Nostoc sp. 'Peltigera membranacea cyanobiont' 210A]|uniref:magnesium-translocating P-type ATPase n=1 Tax=Nostoc sp. 'Peltigera membranacea cyanobiont' 210A TaxID=2014529 RepID=UPI000B95C444|nr:magnesium-translocating P-type ATPase [Nostoc sp. 'Peltigera membranacea cyanobiont' 210A]OYD90850.1 magnesium-translocating P-type ATPase [Nostoc sp. 'Peltigera membranacea cyanobiont' 210A]